MAAKSTKHAAEKVEISTKPVEETAAASPSLIGLVRQLLLAYVGAASLTRDEIEAFVNKLVQRGELAQKDAEKLLREVWLQPGAKKAGQQVEQGMEEVLNRLNIPSHRDIQALNERISQLATRVEELGKA